MAEALATAEAEIGEANPIVTEETMPVSEVEAEVVDEQADVSSDEQPDVAETPDAGVDEELQSLVDEIGEGDKADAENASENPVAEFLASDDFWTTEVEVDTGDGPSPTSLRALVDGFLRQADYTKKTQQLASERKGTEDAVDFHEAFSNDPVAFARALAVRAGLIEEGADPIKQVDAAKIPSSEEQEAEIEKRVEERLQTDPRFIEAQATQAKAAVNAEFDRIQTDRGISLSPAVRQHLIDEAVSRGTTDFEVVLDAEMYRKQQQKQRAAAKQRNAPSRPTTPKSPSVDGDQGVVDDMDDAFARAFTELGAA